MSLDPILWALKDAPVADGTERLVLVTLAERAGRSDGCTAFPSRDTIAETALIDPKTVQRVLRRLEQRGLIAKGDQTAARYIRADRRPVVWDVLIPFSWFPNAARMNEERRQAGLSPLTPEDRPDIAAPPERPRRSDVGKTRGGKPGMSRGDCESPRSEGHGGTDNPARGDCESQTGGLSVPRTSSMNLPENHTLPSVRCEVAPERESAMDGRTEPEVESESQEPQPEPEGKPEPPVVPLVTSTAGVELLRRIAARDARYVLGARVLRDQAMAVDGLLASGWTEEQLVQVIAGRPLPDRIDKSVGAVVSARLRAAMASTPIGVPDGAQIAPGALSVMVGSPVGTVIGSPVVFPGTEKGWECPECSRPVEAEGEQCGQCRREMAAALERLATGEQPTPHHLASPVNRGM